MEEKEPKEINIEISTNYSGVVLVSVITTILYHIVVGIIKVIMG